MTDDEDDPEGEAWSQRANWWAHHVDFFEVTEAGKAAGRVIRIRHRASGISIETICGASRQDSYVDAFIDITEALDEAGIYPPGMNPQTD